MHAGFRECCGDPDRFCQTFAAFIPPRGEGFFYPSVRFGRAVCYTVAMQRNTRLGIPAILLAALLTISATAAEPQKPAPQAGRVTKVNDGDSIEVHLDSGPARVRLAAVDTPEYDQPYGAQSSAAMKALLPLGSTVELEVINQDQFRRLVAVVWLLSDGKRVNINETLLRQGHAWALRRYMREPRFCDLEAEARDQKLGLWAQPVSEWIYPPEWRYLKNGEIRALPAAYAETREKCLEVLKLAGAATYTPPN
jgi:endonuclease YncB( thermonuclease family)